MDSQPARLKTLLLERHWQKYSTFCREYQKAARAIDSTLIDSCPSRAQLHRWMSGQLKGMPYPDACRVLEQMFPDWTARQLMQPCDSDPGGEQLNRPATQLTRIAQNVALGSENPGSTRVEWASPASTGRPLVETLPRSLSDQCADEANEITRSISKNLLVLAKARRLSGHETEQLASLVGNVVDLDLGVEIAPDGWAEVRYRHELFNMSNRPVTRLAREIWFENTDGDLTIEPMDEKERRVGIQRIHDTAHSAKFACQVAPAIQPGEHVTVSYVCRGGQFLSDHYWRQSIARYTRHFTLRLRHHGAHTLRNCTAVEEHPDGAENSAAEDLIWDVVDGDVAITLTRDHLSPNQAITLRWEVRRDVA